MEMLRRAWSGEEPLWKVWWLIGIPLWLAVNVLLARVTRAITSDPLGTPVGAVVITGIVAVTAWLAWCIAAWRYAPNVEHQVWRLGARAWIVMLPVLNYSMGRDYQNLVGDQIVANMRAASSTQAAPATQVPPIDQEAMNRVWYESQASKPQPGPREQPVKDTKASSGEDAPAHSFPDVAALPTPLPTWTATGAK
ncbi:UNVERIFIED_ORG: hypothetical protein BDU10_2510 [Burkholderia sp. CF145]